MEEREKSGQRRRFLFVGAERLQIPRVEDVFRQLPEKSRPLLHRIAATAGKISDERIAQIKLVARARDGHIKQAALLLLALGSFRGTGAGKKPVAKHDDEHHIEFQTFGLMNGGEFE